VLVGYMRVSKADGSQTLDLQRDALQRAGCHVVYEEAASGRNTARSELEQCRRALRNGDTLVAGAGTINALYAGSGNETLTAASTSGAATMTGASDNQASTLMVGGNGSNMFVGG